MSNKEASQTRKKENKDRHNTVLNYVKYTLLYVVIALIVIVPISLALLHFAVNTVHKIQPYFPITITDISLDDSTYLPSNITSGATTLPVMRAGEKVAQLRCDNIGLDVPVYYGSNRLAKANGVGMSVKHSFPGQGKEVLISGNTYGPFRNIENLEEDDELVLVTNWGVYRYVVTGREIAKEVPQTDTFETLILSTQSNKDAFAALSDAHLYIMAEIASGPSVEEVQP